ESETKFRYENTTRSDNGYKINYGAGLEYAYYTNDTYRKQFVGNATQTINYNTRLDLWSWSLFGQISKEYFGDRLSLSLGVRTDANNYSSEMSDLLSQISPRVSASYKIKPDFSVNFNTGRYYQRPAYTTLGFSDATGNLINKANGLKYISVDHLVGGFEYLPDDESVISLEGFYKYYRDYPFSMNDSIALSNKGADYGSFGDEEVLSIAEGHAYGIELLARHRDLWGFNLVFSYTLVRSEFKEFNDNLKLTSTFIPTSWDNIHLLNLTATRDLKRNWQVGFKWRFIGGSPYTPFDENKSSLITAWNARGREYLDYTQFNALRLDPFHQLDIRVDKQYFFDKWSLMFYVDVQNLYNFKSDEPDKLITQTDQNGNVLLDPDDPSRYDLKRIESDGSGTVLPSLGIIVQF
ncbi:MAG TPA: TonB-dependent receptor, partial [Bacteroidales bacterium]|nr:TonB-dependent receptor [Bacteroidales bacterium]